MNMTIMITSIHTCKMLQMLDVHIEHFITHFPILLHLPAASKAGTIGGAIIQA